MVWKLLKITDNLMSSLSDDLIVWKKLISEILRHFRSSESQNIRLSVILRASEGQLVWKINLQIFSEISRYSQCFSGILRSSDHQIIRVAATKLLGSSVPQTLRYIKRISDYQSFSHSVISIFSDYFRLFQQIISSDTQNSRPLCIFRLFQQIISSDTQNSRSLCIFRLSDTQHIRPLDVFQNFTDILRSLDY